MIAYIKGILASIKEDAIIVDVHGIGYEINCANPFQFQRSLHEELLIHTYHHVREDAQILYGFKTENEKFLFEKLISVSGIGPKSGIAILGNVDLAAFIEAVEREDDKFLTGFPGVGKKTARQIILDLKGKLSSVVSISGEVGAPENDVKDENASLTEAKEALKTLGYTEREIKSVLPHLAGGNTDEVIRKALGLLMKK